MTWTGVFPAITTKLKADGALDVAATQASIDRVVANGGRVHAAIKDIPEMKVRVAFAKDPEGNLAELVQMVMFHRGGDQAPSAAQDQHAGHAHAAR